MLQNTLVMCLYKICTLYKSYIIVFKKYISINTFINIFNTYTYMYKRHIPKRLLCRWSLYGIPLQHIFHEYDRFLAGVRYQHGQGRASEIWEFEIHSRGQLISFRPVVFVGCPDHGADLKYFIDLALAGKQRPKRVQLGHYTTDRPNIDRTIISRGVQQHFRCSIPEYINIHGINPDIYIYILTNASREFQYVTVTR